MKKEKTVLIATLPKSGTWYCHFFFWCYDQLLKHKDAALSGEFRPDFGGMLRERKMRNLTSYADTMGLDKLYICHSICPGFAELQDARRHHWQALQFVIEDYNWGETHLRADGEWAGLNPALNPEARIVYLCRNPLDHFVSFYRYSMAHEHDIHRVMVQSDGQQVPVTSLHDFIFLFGSLGAFIKQYYTFRQMREKFPKNILMLPYEDLTRTPEATFEKILRFFDAGPDDSAKKQLFEKALAMCSRESLSKLEQKMNMPLAHNMASKEKHIHSGETGNWKTRLNAEEIASIETVLRFFGISLEDFTLTLEGVQSEMFAPLPSPGGSQCVLDFFLGQMDRTGRQILATNENQMGADSFALSKVVRELRAEQDALLSSRSWRVTAPLRRLGLLFRRKVRLT